MNFAFDVKEMKALATLLKTPGRDYGLMMQAFLVNPGSFGTRLQIDFNPLADQTEIGCDLESILNVKIANPAFPCLHGGTSG